MIRGPTLVPRHAAFLAALTEEGDPVGPADIFAGLAVLRLVNNAAIAGFEIAEPDAIAASTAREAVAALPAASPEAALLLRAVNAVADGARAGIAPTLPILMAYGQVLEAGGRIALACDVYETVISISCEIDEPEFHQAARIRVGYALFVAGDYDGSRKAYTTAHAIAVWRGDVPGQFLADIGCARAARARGNLPAADKQLGAIARAAHKARRPIEAALAMHERAIVAQQRGDLARAVTLAFGAFQLTTNGDHRERLLGDLGGFFVALGRYGAARDALLLQERVARLDRVRRAAQINLVALAARTADRAMFDAYRATLAAVDLPPEFAVNLAIESARGMERFGEPGVARVLLDAARSLAERHQLSRSVFEAEALLNEIGAPRTVTAVEAPPGLPSPTAAVESALRDLAAAGT